MKTPQEPVTEYHLDSKEQSAMRNGLRSSVNIIAKGEPVTEMHLGFMPCKVCNYTAPPQLQQSERKHFNAHAFECTRCWWKPETMPTKELALIAWNQRADSRPVQTGYTVECDYNLLKISCGSYVLNLDLNINDSGLAKTFIAKTKLSHVQTPRDKCWLCGDTGLYGGVDGNAIECTHPTDDRQYTDKGHLIAAGDMDKGSEGMVTVPLAFPKAKYKTEKLVAVPVEMLAGNPSKWPKDEELTPTDGEMEAALKALENLLCLFDTHCHEYGIETLLESGELIHHEHIEKINCALTKKSRGTV